MAWGSNYEKVWVHPLTTKQYGEMKFMDKKLGDRVKFIHTGTDIECECIILRSDEQLYTEFVEQYGEVKIPGWNFTRAILVQKV